MSPIKPPDGRVPSAGGTPTEAAQGPAAAGVQRATESFDAALAGAERAKASAAGEVQQTAGAHAADPIAELAQAVRGGAITPEQALDRLVDRVADGMRDQLSAPQRAELIGVLRSALETDPALAALREALER